MSWNDNIKMDIWLAGTQLTWTSTGKDPSASFGGLHNKIPEYDTQFKKDF